jgi:PPP family 3-phenylpropionic acid transporter
MTGPAAAPERSLFAFGALSFIYFAGMAAFNPYAGLWFTELGFSTLAIGLISSLQAWTRILAPYGWSWLGDHSGRRVELIRIAAAGCLLSALGLLVAERYAVVALVTMALFMCNGGVVPLQEATLAQFLNTREGMDTGRYGRVRVWGSVGFILSVLGVGALLQVLGVTAFPWITAVFNLLLLVVAWRMPIFQETAVHDAPAPPALPLLRRPEVAWFFASTFFTVLAHTVLYAFLSLYLAHLGYGKAAIGAMWAVSVAMEIAFFWFQGRLLGRTSLHRWLEWVGAISALRFAAIAAAGSVPAVLVLAQMSHAITFGAHHATCIAMIHRLFPDRLRGRGQALYTILGYGLSGVLGGVGSGWLIEHIHFEAAFIASSVAAIIAWACARQASRAAAVARLDH